MSIEAISYTTGYYTAGFDEKSVCTEQQNTDIEQENCKKPSDGAVNNRELTREEQQDVAELKAKDREVRAHEMAHIAAGGQYVRGGATFEYQRGPDGKSYAVGGEVSIDTSEVRNDPEATIRKIQVVRKAALAPAKPSSQDRSVAAKATQKETQARQNLTQQKTKNEEVSEKNRKTTENQNTGAYTTYSENGSINPSPALSSYILNIVG